MRKYLRVEIEHAAEREMGTKLEDFLRRRSKISLVVRQKDNLFYESSVRFVDPEFLSIFTFKLKRGEKDKVHRHRSLSNH